MDARDDRIAELQAVLSAQVEFTERLRTAANRAVAHASHISQNYCRNAPREKMKEWAESQVQFSIISMEPSPATALSVAVRSGEAVN